MNTEIPDLEHAIKLRVNTDPAAAAEFFGVKKADANWLKKVTPGIEAAQKVLEYFVLTSTEAPKQASGASESSQDEPEGVSGGPTAEITLASRSPEIPTVEQVADVAAEYRDLFERLKSRLQVDDNASVIEVLKATLDGLWARRVSMLMPMYGSMNPHLVFALVAHIRKQPWMGFHYEADTVIQHARNILAKKFLDSEAEWSWWVDMDTVAPFNDPGFFFSQRTLGADPRWIKPEFVSVMAAERLLAAGKTIVGGVYMQRKETDNAMMVIQPHLHPRSDSDKEIVISLLKDGPRNKVIEVGYVATGCALVHRSVYTDIMARFPDRHPQKEGEPFDFFGHDVGRGGEDIAFCNLAREAGHASFLDLGLWCGHVGNKCFFPPHR